MEENVILWIFKINWDFLQVCDIKKLLILK